jgi:cellulose synthase/poly-beta-1,6-N-acetylglucosamine synthase-like glycosyltransferase
VKRLERLNYPRELLDILFVVEADDSTTRTTLAATSLPWWIRTITVPEGTVRTKPRALNFALGLCRGHIVGVWDAEDAPAPDQLHTVVRHFRTAPPDVACLQGVLDFYGARRNWLSRCFAVEYAAWFRVMLPGLARLGLVVPLGGTTLFFRREALEAVGAWDAHNVTEDAELGLRLARRGYRTVLIDTVTEEEPNARVIAWVRQRSRWLKGYAMTWAAHMRDPRALLAALGWWRFAGVQVLFLGTLSQVLLAPLLWLCWLVPTGLSMPLPPGPLLGVFLVSEAVNMIIGGLGVIRSGRTHLLKWVPTLILYYPLATAAAAKALYETVARPFYWDKTPHGLVADADPAPVPVAAPTLTLPQRGKGKASG